jgi:hypothetical protein
MRGAQIEIITAPPGSAPQELRADWVGVRIPLASEEEVRQFHALQPSRRKRARDPNAGGYLVLRATAVAALHRAGKPAAATFWSSAEPDDPFLQFNRTACKPIER